MVDDFHLDLDAPTKEAVAKLSADSLEQTIAQEKKWAAEGIDIHDEKAYGPPVIARVTRAEYGGNYPVHIAVDGELKAIAVYGQTRLHLEDPHVQQVVFPYVIGVRANDWVHAQIVPVDKRILRYVSEGKHFHQHPSDNRGLHSMRPPLRGGYVFVPRQQNPVEIAVKIERVNDEGVLQEVYEGISFNFLVHPPKYAYPSIGRDLVFKKA